MFAEIAIDVFVIAGTLVDTKTRSKFCNNEHFLVDCLIEQLPFISGSFAISPRCALYDCVVPV